MSKYLVILERMEEWQRLKPSRRRYVLAMVEAGGNDAKARRLLGTRSHNSRAVGDPDVQACLRAVMVLAAEKAGITLEGHLDELARLRDKSVDLENMNAAVNAEAWRGRAAGFYDPDKRDRGKRVPTDEEVAEVLAARLGRPKEEILQKLRGAHAETQVPQFRAIEDAESVRAVRQTGGKGEDDKALTQDP